jgi:dihydropteroate synthase
MVGHSHKSMFSSLAGVTDDRFVPTVAATTLAAERGADLVRVHDVAAAVEAIGTVRETTGGR